MINKINDIGSIRKIIELEDKINELEHEKEKLSNEKENLELLVRLLQEQMALTKAQQYTASSEKYKYVEGEQLGLFDEAENTVDLNEVQKETELEEITYKRKKRKNHESMRSDDFSGLPVEEIHYEINEEERTCECCGSSLHEISVDTRIELEIIPAKANLKKGLTNDLCKQV